MTKRLLYMASIALTGVMVTEAPAAPAAWPASTAPNVAAATGDAKDAPPVLVRRGGAGNSAGVGGCFRRGGGGVRPHGAAIGGRSLAGGAGHNRGNFNTANLSQRNVNRNVNVQGYGHGHGGHGHGGHGHGGHHGHGYYYGPSWGGVAAGVAAGAAVGAAAARPYYYPVPTAPAPTVRYWCDTYQGYYPAVPECPVPWRQVTL